MSTFVSFSVLSIGSTKSNEDQLLLASCQALATDSEQDAPESCRYYIKGFLTGALATDTAITNEQSEKQSAFVERAYRTRIGKTESSSESFSLFCVPDGESQDRIVDIVSKELSSSTDSTKKLTTQIYNVLKNHYPCE